MTTYGAYSGITENSYTLENKPVTITPASGTYNSNQTVSLVQESPVNENATIYYTDDGTTPSETNGNVYYGTFTISSSANLKAIVVYDGWTDSPITSSDIELKVGVVPVITPSGQYFASSPQQITITCSGSYDVYYTTDGSTPSADNGTLYSSAFNISSSGTITAVATRAGWTDGDTTSESYTFYNEVALPYYNPIVTLEACGDGYYDMCEIQWIPAVFPDPYYLEFNPSCSSPMRWGFESWGGGLERIVTIRFPGIEIPRRASIQGVQISIRHDYGNPEGNQVHGEGMFAVDDYTQFDDENDYLSRVWTEQAFYWGVINYNKNTWYTISSEWLVASVQEVIDLPSWNSGQALILKLTAPDSINDPTNRVRIACWFGEQDLLPRLQIWYRTYL